MKNKITVSIDIEIDAEDLIQIKGIERAKKLLVEAVKKAYVRSDIDYELREIYDVAHEPVAVRNVNIVIH
jgi:hypothetical protein